MLTVFLSRKSTCDTEDWSNDAENLALHHRNKLHLKYILIENIYFNVFVETMIHIFMIL